jgi:hypothetical protein
MIRPTRRSILVKSSKLAVGVVMVVFMSLFVEVKFRYAERRNIVVKVAKYILIAGLFKVSTAYYNQCRACY